MESFLSSINTFLKLIPDNRPKGIPELIRPKCCVVNFPMSYPNLTKSPDCLCKTEVKKYDEDDEFDKATVSTSFQDTSERDNKATPLGSCGIVLPEGSKTTESNEHKEHLKTTGLNKECEKNDIHSELATSEEHSCTRESDCSREKRKKTHSESNGSLGIDPTWTSPDSSSMQTAETSTFCSHNTFTEIRDFVERDNNKTESIPVRVACDRESDDKKPLHIVWPHRWEHDKGPQAFFNILFQLKNAGLEFHLSVLGEQFTEVPDIFEEAKKRLSSNIRHWGYQNTKKEYFETLQQADCVVSTALHEFFGVAMLEAVFCGCYPLCPNRLVYPEIFPREYLYNTDNQLYKRLRDFCQRPWACRNHKIQVDVHQYSWDNLKMDFKKLLEPDKT